MDEASPARTNQRAYLEARTRQLHHTNTHTTDQDHVIRRLLFHRLPTLAAQLFSNSTTATTASDNSVYFFNEHYVVKPPSTAVEFRWHRDDDEQLAMCVHRDSIPRYLSAWCALDDVTNEMGPLRFASPSTSIDSAEELEELEKLATPPLCVPAGTVVWFWSDLWHCSSANESTHTRRAFYAQYSRSPISARPKEDTPLSFAIKCVATDE